MFIFKGSWYTPKFNSNSATALNKIIPWNTIFIENTMQSDSSKKLGLWKDRRHIVMRSLASVWQKKKSMIQQEFHLHWIRTALEDQLLHTLSYFQGQTDMSAVGLGTLRDWAFGSSWLRGHHILDFLLLRFQLYWDYRMKTMDSDISATEFGDAHTQVMWAVMVESEK